MPTQMPRLPGMRPAVRADGGPRVGASAATVGCELRSVAGGITPVAERLLALGARPVELDVYKNRLGPTGLVPLRFVAGAGVFEERAP